MPDPTFLQLSGCFSLLSATGGVLHTLPATLRLTSPLGEPDPYDWDHPPGSNTWFALGDGISNERPRVTFEGEATYSSPADALNDIEAIRTALAGASSLGYRGNPVAYLERTGQGGYEPAFGATMRQVTHRLVLNTLTWLTSADLIGTGTPLPPPPITNPDPTPTTPPAPTNPTPTDPDGYYTTVTMLIDGLPTVIQVWRPNP